MNTRTLLGGISTAIIDKDCSSQQLGMSFRRSSTGPEYELVETFLREFSAAPPTDCKITIFREPRIESGYPDLVIVVWDVTVAERWEPLRSKLSTLDIRIMHYLANSEAISFLELCAHFSKRVSVSLGKLENAGMVSQSRGDWVAEPLSKTYATRHIIAIEAKIANWQGALKQAYLNTWFASSSYVITPRIPKTMKLVSQANRLGIDIKTLDNDPFAIPKTASENLPLSYASWLFNEWAWRSDKVAV